MEAIRYLSDSHPAKMETSSLSALSIATRAAGLLIQHLGEDNQRLILACLIFGFGTESLDQEELRQLFGGKVMEYLSITRKPEELAIRKLQRLTPKETRERIEAGRKIVLARYAAVWLYSKEAGKITEIPAEIAEFSHLYPKIDQLLKDS